MKVVAADGRQLAIPIDRLAARTLSGCGTLSAPIKAALDADRHGAVAIRFACRRRIRKRKNLRKAFALRRFHASRYVRGT